MMLVCMLLLGCTDQDAPKSTVDELVGVDLSFFVPKLYTAIAFDSGGVASGPLTSSFILPLSIGACSVIHGGDDSILS